MDDQPKQAPEALRPIYETAQLNQTLVLFDGIAKVEAGPSSEHIPLRVEFAWLPSPCVTVVIQGWEISSDAQSLLEGASELLTEVNLTCETDPTTQIAGFVRRIKHSSTNGFHCEIIINDFHQWDANVSLRHATFHVANFPDFHGRPISSDRSSWLGRSEFSADGWEITFDCLPRTELLKSSKDSGGYCITHVGEVTHQSGQFSAADLERLFSSLRLFLSFCCGRWCGPLLWSGAGNFDLPPDQSWTCWLPTKTSPARSVQSWANKYVIKEAFDAFETFHMVYHDDDIGAAIRTASYWYVEANASGVTENAIVLSNIALECLADTLLTDSRRLLSPEGLSKLETHDRLRLVLATHDLETAVPDELSALQRVANARNWDGPEALATIRHWEIHPTRKNRQKIADFGVTREVKHEVRTLGLLYLELLLLRVIGYDGRYLNRTRKGIYTSQVEKMPWSGKDEKS